MNLSLQQVKRSGLAQRAKKRFDRAIADQFARTYHKDAARTWLATEWFGHRIWKLPADMWVYQMLIHQLSPDLIVETGTAEGGSALYMANLLDLMGHGQIITVDVQGFDGRPVHERIRYLLGSSSDREVLEPVFQAAERAETVMVILDSDHSRDHVLVELELLAPLVTRKSYLIVEDSNVNGHPIMPKHGPGPAEALAEWLPRNPEFVADRSCERYHHTFNPGGYLRRSGASHRGG